MALLALAAKLALALATIALLATASPRPPRIVALEKRVNFGALAGEAAGGVGRAVSKAGNAAQDGARMAGKGAGETGGVGQLVSKSGNAAQDSARITGKGSMAGTAGAEVAENPGLQRGVSGAGDLDAPSPAKAGGADNAAADAAPSRKAAQKEAAAKWKADADAAQVKVAEWKAQKWDKMTEGQKATLAERLQDPNAVKNLYAKHGAHEATSILEIVTSGDPMRRATAEVWKAEVWEKMSHAEKIQFAKETLSPEKAAELYKKYGDANEVLNMARKYEMEVKLAKAGAAVGGAAVVGGAVGGGIEAADGHK